MQMYEVFEDVNYLYMVCELCSGGEMFDYITDNNGFREKDAANVLAQILSALEYLHEECDPPIAHCDLKPDNFLFAREPRGSDFDIKVIDFGMSKRIHHAEHSKKLQGTAYYMAPEVVEMAEGSNSGS